MTEREIEFSKVGYRTKDVDREREHVRSIYGSGMGRESGYEEWIEGVVKGGTRGTKNSDVRLRCMVDLRYMCRDVLGMKDWDILHDGMAEWWNDNTNHKRKLLLIPRGHLKSSIITIGGTIQRIVRNPNIRVLIAHAIWDHSRGFVRKISSYLTDFSRLPEYFGDFRGKKDTGSVWTKESIRVAQITEPNVEATVTATGVERVQAGQHYDYIIFDDVVERENVSTKEQRAKIKQFYKDCLSLLEPGGEFVVIGTTWHEDDLYNDLRKDPAYKVYCRTAIEDDAIIFPKKFSVAILDDLKKELGPYSFSSQYMLNPYPEEDLEFKKEWIKEYNSVPAHVPMYVSLVLDPSLGKAKGDSAGLTVTGVTDDGIVYVLNARRFKMDIAQMGDELAREIMDIKANYGRSVDAVGIESFGFQQSIEPSIRAAFDKAGISVPIEMIKGKTYKGLSKEDRILALVPYYASGKVYMSPTHVDLKEELVRFRRTRKAHQVDDIIDSLAYQCLFFWERKGSNTADVAQSYKPGTFGDFMETAGVFNKIKNDLFDDLRSQDYDNEVWIQ
jgi:predicted phage terminase large subunit-like protein